MWRHLPILLLLLTACGDGDPGAVVDLPEVEPPPAYSFGLTSTCGERALIGTYRVWVEDDEVVRVRPETDERLVPTLLGLERLAEEAGPDAEVEVVRDVRGWVTWLSIDHLPDAIDDEECYRVSDVVEGTGPAGGRADVP